MCRAKLAFIHLQNHMNFVKYLLTLFLIMNHYHISYQYPNRQFIDIELTLYQLDQELLYLQLPAWRPGRYEISNFAKNIQRFQAEDAQGNALPFKKISKDRWEIQTSGKPEVHIKYNYYAATLDAGSTWLDENQLYINFVNCIMYAEGRQDDPFRISLDLPEGYEIACGLKKIGRHMLEAPGFYHLAESPLLAAPHLTHWQYQVKDHIFHIWVNGLCRLEKEKTLQKFTAFTKEQIDTMGDFPCEEYHFIYQFLPYRAYHGVEHFNSTVITLGPSEQILENTKLYEDFLGVSSHELFHTWNIIRIRPQEMMPYDYTRENYFPTGFVAEGVTTYYGDLFLVRSGAIQKSEYFAELNKIIKRHFENFGRFNHSLAESSHDLWLDGYAAGIPNRKVSIYVKGALVSLILDLELRRITANEHSLDTVMRYLWENFAKHSRGYTLQDLKNIVTEFSDNQLLYYFADFISGKLPLEQKINEVLQTVGCYLKETESAILSERMFGFRTAMKEGKLVVSAMEPDSVADRQLRLEDEIVAVNKRKVTENIEELMTAQEVIELAVFRHHHLQNIILENDGRSYFNQFSIEQDANATKEEQENFFHWLKCEW